MATSRFSPTNPCAICGGTIGSGIDGAHCLCAARVRQGLPTPCLGHPCAKCGGAGWFNPRVTEQTRFPVFFDPYEMARAMKAIFPPCPDCGGTGHAKDAQ